jgi:hypothetical protein
MRELFLTVALVATALIITFGVGAYLEHTAFRVGPEPGSINTPSSPTPPPAERRGRARQVV